MKSRRTPCTSPGPDVFGYVHGVGAAAGNSDHVEEERNIFTSRGRNIARVAGAHLKPSGHVPNHAGDLSRATGHLRAAVAKRLGRPPAAQFLLLLHQELKAREFEHDFS